MELDITLLITSEAMYQTFFFGGRRISKNWGSNFGGSWGRRIIKSPECGSVVLLGLYF